MLTGRSIAKRGLVVTNVSPSDDSYYDGVSQRKCHILGCARFLYGLLDKHGDLSFGDSSSFDASGRGGNFEKCSARECVGVMAREGHGLLALQSATPSAEEYRKRVNEFAACAVFASHLFEKGLGGDVSITSLCFKCIEELRCLGEHLQDPRNP